MKTALLVGLLSATIPTTLIILIFTVIPGPNQVRLVPDGPVCEWMKVRNYKEEVVVHKCIEVSFHENIGVISWVTP